MGTKVMMAALSPFTKSIGQGLWLHVRVLCDCLVVCFVLLLQLCAAARVPSALFPFTGAATTVYCCLKALPSQHNLFFQDCTAIPNRLPQADDDAAAEQLYIARSTAAAVR